MRSSWLCALLAIVIVIGCKTPDSASSAKGDLTGGEPAVASAVDVESYNDTFWKAEFTAQFDVVVTLRVEQEGNGTMTIDSDGEIQSLEFAALRLASADELAQYRTNLGDKFLDARGLEVSFTDALVLADMSGGLKNILPILHEGELFIYPVGPLLKQVDSPEADVAKCGGMVGLKCPAGFLCKGALLDKMGSCVAAPAPAAPGIPTTPEAPAVSKCGGFAGIECPQGLICRVMPPNFDGFGRCVQPAGGQATTPKTSGKTNKGPAKCGTLAGLQCPKGQVCKKKSANATGDVPGICVDK